MAALTAKTWSVGCAGPPGPLQDDMRELGVGTFALGMLSRATLPLAVARLVRILRAHRAQIVQTHLVDGCLVGLAAARVARVPVAIMTAHHSHELPFHGRRLGWPDKLCAGPLSDHIVAPSENVAETIVRYLGTPRRKIEVIHHGFDMARFAASSSDRSAVRSELGLEGKVVVGSVGRLYWLKNQEALVRAFAGVGTDAVLVIAGPGDPAPLQALSQALGVDDRVLVVGSRADVPALLAAFDVFAHPAIAESFGMVIIEALATGLPTMATPVGIVPEVIDASTGVMAASPSVPDLEAALRGLLSRQGDWAEMGQVARSRVSGFTATAMARQHARLYSRWLAQAVASAP